MITFTVRGIPAPQGSKRAFRNKYSGRIQQVESSKRVAPWRSDVRDAAIDAVTEDRDGMGWMRDPLTGPVAVALEFRMPRPKGHYGSGRNAAVLRASAPTRPAGKPDVDKLARAILDAITAIVIADDAQVVSLTASKVYADEHRPVGVHVVVTDLDAAITPPDVDTVWFGGPLIPTEGD
jgi:Holliday junction resolvase RusA-like endonuclease